MVCWVLAGCSLPYVPVGFHTYAISSDSDSDAELSISALDNHQLTGFVLRGLASESADMGQRVTHALLR